MSKHKTFALISLAIGLIAGCGEVAEPGKGVAAVTETPPHITDKIANIDRYAALNPRFPKAFEFLKRPDLSSLPCGRYEIIPGECWAMVQEADLKPYVSMKLEAHRKYIDIQSPLSRDETFGLFIMDKRALAAEFDEKDDVCFPVAEDKSAVTAVKLKKGEFAIFFPPLGAHAPCCTTDDTGRIKKLVVKVLAE